MRLDDKLKFLSILIGATTILSACTSSKSAEDWERRDVPNHKEVRVLNFSVMDESSNGKILKKLDSHDFVVLRKVDGGYEIAIRALYTYLGGEFEVYENDDNSISVYHCALGDEYEEPHKTMLKIFVHKLPEAVYVFYSIDS
jgi:hypothetical protein